VSNEGNRKWIYLEKEVSGMILSEFLFSLEKELNKKVVNHVSLLRISQSLLSVLPTFLAKKQLFCRHRHRTNNQKTRYS